MVYSLNPTGNGNDLPYIKALVNAALAEWQSDHDAGPSLGPTRSAEAHQQRQKPAASELVRAVGFFRPAGQRMITRPANERRLQVPRRYPIEEEVAPAQCRSSAAGQRVPVGHARGR